MPNKTSTDFYESAGGFVVRDGLMLLVRKLDTPEVRMPKGHVEAGESYEAAARREVTEETGYAGVRILASLGKQSAEFDRYGRWTRRNEYAYLMTLESEAIVPRSASDTQRFEPVWIPVQDVPALLTFATEKEFARRALAWLARWDEGHKPKGE